MRKDKLIIALLFTLLLSGCAIAQQKGIVRMSTLVGKDSVLVTKYPSKTLEFNYNGDTLFSSIYIDSLSHGEINCWMYVNYPKNTDLSNTMVKVVFEDGSYDYLMPHRIDSDLYVEYDFNQSIFLKLYTIGVKEIFFNNSLESSKLDDINYFSYFLNNHYK